MTTAGGRAGAAHVIGDGPAALTAAISLAQRRWSVGLSTSARPSSHRRRIDVLGGSALGSLARLGISRADMLAIAQPCPGTWSRWGGEGHCLDHVRTLYGAWAVDQNGLVGLLAKRAMSAGVCFHPRSPPPDALTPPFDEDESGRWTIVATGNLPARSGRGEGDHCDDRLLALVGIGMRVDVGSAADSRLLIEASPEGWSYCVAGPGRTVCAGVVTDAQSLHGWRPRTFAMRVLAETQRIADVLEDMDGPLDIRGISVVCRRRRLLAGRRSVRVGDAHISFDPLAGRGLWEAITTTMRVTAALYEHPDRLDAVERDLQAGYAQYLLRRSAFYQEGYAKFGTGFWARRGPFAASVSGPAVEDESGALSAGRALPAWPCPP